MSKIIILTIMGFIGLSSIRSMQNIMNKVIKFTGKYSIFIPLFAGMTGVISYWLVIKYIELNKIFINAGLKSAGNVPDVTVKRLGLPYRLLGVGIYVGIWIMLSAILIEMVSEVYNAIFYKVSQYGIISICFLWSLLFTYGFLYMRVYIHFRMEMEEQAD